MRLGRLHIAVLLIVASGFWSLVLLCQGTVVGWDHLQPFGVVVTILGLLGLTFDRWLWRHRWLHGWFVKRPDLRGTWRVKLESDWINPKTGRKVPTIYCYMGVKQTLSSLQMHLMTPESQSWLLAESILPSLSRVGYQIVGVYSNKPKTELRGVRSEMHFGSILFDTHGPEHCPETIDGEYWTDRPSKGRMILTDRHSKPFTRFEDAEADMGQPEVLQAVRE